jgi:TonB family protein
MNPAETIPDSWAPRQWRWAVGLVFVAQLLLVALFSERAPRAPRSAAAGTTLTLALDASSNRQLNDALRVGDPTRHALANPQGFSGPAWLAEPSLERPLAGWTEPPGWLGHAVAPLGKAFAGFAGTNATLPARVASKPSPRVTELALTPEPVTLKSTVRVAGDLKSRPFATPLTLPELPHEDVLRPSIVEVLVLPDGEIFSATIRSGSGLKAADDRALELANTARFQPLKPGGTTTTPEFTTGTLIFNWHTKAPAARPTP